MEARLVYIINGVEIELEKMDMEDLDNFTYKNFHNEEEILDSEFYKDKIKGFPRDGEFKIAFNVMDAPIQSFDYLVGFDFEPFGKESQYLSVLVGNLKFYPTRSSLRMQINRLLYDIEVVGEFFETFQDLYTEQEKIFCRVGIQDGNEKLAFEGLERIVDDAIGYDDYFIARIFVDGLNKFDALRKKNYDGINEDTPKIFEKDINKNGN